MSPTKKPKANEPVSSSQESEQHSTPSAPVSSNTNGVGINNTFLQNLRLRDLLSSEVNLVLSILVSISLAQFLSMLVGDISLSTLQWLSQTLVVSLLTVVLILFLIHESRTDNRSIISRLTSYLLTVGIILFPYSLQRFHNVPADWTKYFVGCHTIILGVLFIFWGGWDLYMIKKMVKQEPGYSSDIIKIILGAILILIAWLGVMIL